MLTVTRRIHYDSRTDEFLLLPLPDVHLGNVACDERALSQFVQRIADNPRAFWLGMGDYADFINVKDWRYDPETLAKWLWGKGDIAREQIRQVLERLKPVANKCIGLLSGNHEQKIYHHWERDVYGEILAGLGASPDNRLRLDFAGFVRLIFVRSGHDTWVADIFATHGWWAGRLYGNGALQLERLSGWVDADIVLAGHDHKCRAFSLSKISVARNGKVGHRTVLCGSVGTFLNQPRYAEELGYRPTPTRWLEIVIRPSTRELRVLL